MHQANVEERRPWSGRNFVVSPDGQWVAAVGPEHTVQVWQVVTERLRATYYGHRAGVYNRTTKSIKEVVWVDNERVVSESQDGSIQLWHARTATHLRTFVEAGQLGTRVASVQDAVRLLQGEVEPASIRS